MGVLSIFLVVRGILGVVAVMPVVICVIILGGLVIGRVMGFGTVRGRRSRFSKAGKPRFKKFSGY